MKNKTNPGHSTFNIHNTDTGFERYCPPTRISSEKHNHARTDGHAFFRIVGARGCVVPRRALRLPALATFTVPPAPRHAAVP
eukprot:scaffold47447_cov51-Phaeocystis_antarctica.AAC.1